MKMGHQKGLNVEFDKHQGAHHSIANSSLFPIGGIFSPKKLVFFEKKKKNPPQIFFLPFFYKTFQCGGYNVFIFFFFANKKLKKPPSKVAHNLPKPFFPQTSQTHSQQPKIDF